MLYVTYGIEDDDDASTFIRPTTVSRERRSDEVMVGAHVVPDIIEAQILPDMVESQVVQDIVEAI